MLNEIEIEGDVAVAESDGVNTIGDKHEEEFLYATEGGSDFFTTTLSIDGRPCKDLLDIGASRTILTSDIAQPTRKSDRTLRAYNGGVVETLGMADVTIASESRSMTCSCFIVPKGRFTILFGQDVIKELELLAHVRVVETEPVKIRVPPEAIPIAQPARRPPFNS